MSWGRAKAVMWRHIYNFRHSLDRVFDMFYWPAMDLLIWGLTSSYIRQAVPFPDLVKILLTGMVFWQVVWRSQYEVTTNLLEEIWAHNVVSLFSTPLTVAEWMVGVILLGLIKMVFTIIFVFSLAFLMYGVKVLEIGWLLVPFLTLLLMSGWYVGFLVSGIIIRFGTRIQTLAWSGVYLLAPFSAIYYPVETLPMWAQKVAVWVPASYVFEGMRSMLATRTIDQANLVKSGIMTGGYLLLSIGFFFWMFKSSKKQGLDSLE